MFKCTKLYFVYDYRHLLGSLQRFPDPLDGFKAGISKRRDETGGKEKGKGKRRK